MLFCAGLIGGKCRKSSMETVKMSFGNKVKLDLKSKVRDGKLYVDQGIIAGCAGGDNSGGSL